MKGIKVVLILLLPLLFLQCTGSPGKASAPATGSTSSANDKADTVIIDRKVYATAAFGLSMREKPRADAKVVGKIPYGTVVAVSDQDAGAASSGADTITIDGMKTYWVRATYGKITGYVIDAYLSDYAAPPAGTEDLKGYARKTGKPFGPLYSGRYKEGRADGPPPISFTRQLFDNGVIYTEGTGYEYFYAMLQLPHTAIYKVYNSLKTLTGFADVFAANTALRRGKYKIKKGDTEYEWEVRYDESAGYAWPVSIKISWSDGAYNTLAIEQGEAEVTVNFSSGV